MIHLDRNHSSPIARHPKSNLILADPTHADQSSLLSWSAPTRNDNPYYHESQNNQSKPSIASDLSKDSPKSHPGPITRADGDLLKLPEHEPSSPADASSPVEGSSSSLSPPPDAVSPGAQADAETADASAVHMNAEGKEAQPEENKGGSADDVDRASRQSTPLSELSSAPDDDVQEGEIKDGDVSVPAPADCDQGSSETACAPDHPKEGTQQAPTPAGANSGVAPSKVQSPHQGLADLHTPILPNVSFPGSSHLHSSSTAHASPTSISSLFSQPDGQPLHSDATSINTMPSFTTSASGSSLAAGNDPKVVMTLELNAHLLNVMMAFQTRNNPADEKLRHEYSMRLQTNLAWLAAAADGPKSRLSVPLPAMQPPPPVDFTPVDRIQQIYVDLPVVFAKEYAYRQQHAAAAAAGRVDLSGKLKRERPEEIMPDLANKRQDIGETKMPTPIAPAPSLSAPVTPQAMTGIMPNAASPPASISMHGTPVSRMNSPAMPLPPVPPTLMGGMNEAQIAASRMRQMQMRQALQQQQQFAEANRQMSPPTVPQTSNMGMHNVAGPSSMPGQLSQVQMGGIANIGPNAMQHVQILQNPGHPLVQYLIQQVPGFMTLPLQQQLQHMQRAQNLLQQRQRTASQSQAGSSTQGFMQSSMQSGMSPGMQPGMQPGMTSGMQMGMQSFQGGGMSVGMSSAQIPGQSRSPTRVSPISQQNAMQGQNQMGGFPFSKNVPNAGMDQRLSQQQAAMAHQRQLILLQQQMLRNAQGGNQQNPMMNPQMMAAAQQEQWMRQEQRMAQAQVGMTNPGMQMGGGMGGMGGLDNNHIPALRSNPTVPGIARSTRTPSDSAPSPGVQQRISGHSSEDLQRAMMMQQQAQQRGMTPQMQQNPSFPQMNWNQANQSQMAQMAQIGHGQGYGMSPPNSANPMHGGFGGMQGGMPPASQVGAQNQWQQNVGGGQFGFTPSPSASQHHSDAAMTPRQASATPVPHQMAQNSPQTDQAGLNDFDLFNWGQ